jgi:putative FmdB family regulatory protein
MPIYDQHCQTCGWLDEILVPIGHHPPCPRCGGETERIWLQKAPGACGDDAYIGGLTLENVGPEPVTFYSRSEKRRYLKEHGLVEMVRHVPVPGTDTSPHTSSWTGVDLEAGRILAERQAQTKASTTPHRANPETIAIIKQFYEEHYAQHGRD